MNEQQLQAAAAESVKFLIVNDPTLAELAHYGLPNVLQRMGSDPEDEWQDTVASFMPGVMALYPDITPHPEAEAYGVGYGELVACKWNGTRFKQFAVWADGVWEDV